MATIGYINKNAQGHLIGKIETIAFSQVIGLRRFVSDNPKAPHFEIMALNAAGNWVKIGALFAQTIKSSGGQFFQGRIDDPSMGAAMDIALFVKEDGGYNIAWNRSRKGRTMPAGEAELPPLDGANDADAHTDGLGESTAPDAPTGGTGGKGKGAASKSDETAEKLAA